MLQSASVPASPSRAASYGLAACCVLLGVLTVTWYHFREGDPLPWESGFWQGDSRRDGFVPFFLGLCPYFALAVAALWPWTSRGGGWVLAVAVALVGFIGARTALGAPYRYHAFGAPIIPTALAAWVGQCVVAGLAVVVSSWMWWRGRRKQKLTVTA